MATSQSLALERVKKLFSSGFTEDHENYRLVGYKQGALRIQAIGDSWDQAIARLESAR